MRFDPVHWMAVAALVLVAIARSAAAAIPVAPPLDVHVLSTGEAAEGSDLIPIWKALAKARVLVSIEALGAESKDDKPTRKFGWYQTMRALADAVSADPQILSRIHEIWISEGKPGAEIRPLPSASGAVVLALKYGFARRSTGLIPPKAADIQAAVAGRGPRPKLDAYEFDERFPLFMAGLGLGVKVVRHDPNEHASFHRALAALGARVAGLTTQPRTLERVQGPAIGRDLQNFADVLAFALDPLTQPQIELRPGDEAAVGLRDNQLSASFPAWAAMSPLTAYIIYTEGTGQVPDLDAVDRCMGDWVRSYVTKRGTPAEADLRKAPITVCVVPRADRQAALSVLALTPTGSTAAEVLCRSGVG